MGWGGVGKGIKCGIRPMPAKQTVNRRKADHAIGIIKNSGKIDDENRHRTRPLVATRPTESAATVPGRHRSTHRQDAPPVGPCLFGNQCKIEGKCRKLADKLRSVAMRHASTTTSSDPEATFALATRTGVSEPKLLPELDRRHVACVHQVEHRGLSPRGQKLMKKKKKRVIHCAVSLIAPDTSPGVSPSIPPCSPATVPA